MMNQDKQIMGFIAIALVAVMTIYVSSIPKKSANSDASDARQASVLEPAAGDVVPGSVAGTTEVVAKTETTPEAVTGEAVAEETTKAAEDATKGEKPADTGEAYPVVKIYGTIEECTKDTNTVCHFVKCKGAESVGKEPTENVIENECDEGQKSGWRAVVTVPDKTAIPDVIAPPAKTEE